MSYWKYIFSQVRKITEIKVHYKLITQSGETILQMEDSEFPKSIIFCKHEAFGQYDVARRLGQKAEIKKKYDQLAEELLNKFQEKNRNQIASGYLDGGDYIVKCIWYLSVDTEYLNYEEFKKFNGELI